MRLVAAVFVVAGDMVEVAIAAGEEASAEAARPGLLALRVLDDALGVRTCRAAVCVLVVLVERVGSPEDAIAVRAWVALVPLVELVLVPLPVELALERDVTKCAPISTLRFRGAPIAAFGGRCRALRLLLLLLLLLYWLLLLMPLLRRRRWRREWGHVRRRLRRDGAE